MINLSSTTEPILGFPVSEIKKIGMMLFGESENLEIYQVIEILILLLLKQLGFDVQNIQIILKKFSLGLKKAIEEGIEGKYAGSIQILDNKYVILNGFKEVFDLETLTFVEIIRPPIFSFAISIDGLIRDLKDLLI